MIPDHATLAPLASSAIEGMIGLSLPVWAHSHPEHPWRDPAEAWHTMSVSIEGAPPLLVAAGVAPACGKALAAAMFGLTPEEVEEEMVRDSLGEVVNVLAGRLKGAMNLTQAMGVPKALAREHLRAEPSQALHAALLLGDEVRVWVLVTT